jgi:hypothetical protein
MGYYNNFSYTDISSSEIMIIKYGGKEKNVSIPSEIDGKKVVSIGEDCFKNNSFIIEVTIPSGVITIFSRAFYCCTNLKKITIPATVTEIFSHAFYKCSALEYLKTNANIYNNAFAECINLNTVYLGYYSRHIGKYAFYNCTKLTKCKVSDNLNIIEKFAFKNVPIPIFYRPKNCIIYDESFDDYTIVTNQQQ